RAGDTLKLNLVGPIGDVDEDQRGIYATAVESLLLRHRGRFHDIECSIETVGGSVNEGLRIYNLLRGAGAFVRTIARRRCVSMGRVWRAAGDFRQAARGPGLKIHDPALDPAVSDRRWTAEKHRRAATQLEKLNATINRILVQGSEATWATLAVEA